MAFKYLISECYSRDMSVKTKTAKYAKMQRGEYQSKICPYGYRKSADGRMEIDENVAEIVRLIFRWAAEGTHSGGDYQEVVRRNIPTPGEYRKSKGQSFYDVSRTHGTWSSSTVLRMLEDERYIGTYVIGKRAVTEIGGHRIRLKDESEWYKIPDHHPAIVSKELFEQAKAGIRRFSIPNKKQHDYPLRGKSVLRLLRPCTVTDYTISEVLLSALPGKHGFCLSWYVGQGGGIGNGCISDHPGTGRYRAGG